MNATRRPGPFIDPNILVPTIPPLSYTPGVLQNGYYQSSDMLPGPIAPPPGGFPEPGRPGPALPTAPAPNQPGLPRPDPFLPPIATSEPERTPFQNQSTVQKAMTISIITSPLWGIILLRQLRII